MIHKYNGHSVIRLNCKLSSYMDVMDIIGFVPYLLSFQYLVFLYNRFSIILSVPVAIQLHFHLVHNLDYYVLDWSSFPLQSCRWW